MKRVAVTGAGGYVGRFVCAELLTRGVEVRALTRSGAALEALDGVEPCRFDLAEPAGFAEALRGCDGLVHAAYAHAFGRYRGGEGDDLAGFLSANLWGGVELLRVARDAGVERCAVLSSRAAYGATAKYKPTLSEADPLAPDTHYGALKAALEAFVQSWGLQGWHVAALRPTGVYGLTHPLERSKWHGLARWAVTGEGDAPAPRAGAEVHGADVARALWLLLNDDRAAGEVHDCSDLIVQHRDVARAARAAAGLPPGGPLPDAAPPPFGVMSCHKLKALGWQPGGRRLFEDTVAELAIAVRSGRA